MRDTHASSPKAGVLVLTYSFKCVPHNDISGDLRHVHSAAGPAACPIRGRGIAATIAASATETKNSNSVASQESLWQRHTLVAETGQRVWLVFQADPPPSRNTHALLAFHRCVRATWVTNRTQVRQNMGHQHNEGKQTNNVRRKMPGGGRGFLAEGLVLWPVLCLAVARAVVKHLTTATFL